MDGKALRPRGGSDARRPKREASLPRALGTHLSTSSPTLQSQRGYCCYFGLGSSQLSAVHRMILFVPPPLFLHRRLKLDSPNDKRGERSCSWHGRRATMSRRWKHGLSALMPSGILPVLSASEGGGEARKESSACATTACLAIACRSSVEALPDSAWRARTRGPCCARVAADMVDSLCPCRFQYLGTGRGARAVC